MKVNPELATETIIKNLIYLNIIFLIGYFFVDNYKIFSLSILLCNLIFLLLRQGIKKESNNIMYRGSQ